MKATARMRRMTYCHYPRRVVLRPEILVPDEPNSALGF
jgi:ABC-type microcin C transport system duplicated ATPase subunit YejF